MRPRSIILLCAHRSGSSAVERIFAKHPDVRRCHVDGSIRSWEPNFWNLAVEALDGDSSRLRARLAESLPFLEVPERVTQEVVFDLWDQVLGRLGPIVFDKSPRYLSSFTAFEDPPSRRLATCLPIELIQRYRARGNDVRLIAIVRDPRDVLDSQVQRFDGGDASTLAWRVPFWLDQYENLEGLRRSDPGIPVFRYEDLVAAPHCYVPMLLAHCGLAIDEATWDHLRPVNVRRHSRGSNRGRLARHAELAPFLERYGYADTPAVGARRPLARLRSLGARAWHHLRRSGCRAEPVAQRVSRSKTAGTAAMDSTSTSPGSASSTR